MNKKSRCQLLQRPMEKTHSTRSFRWSVQQQKVLGPTPIIMRAQIWSTRISSSRLEPIRMSMRRKSLLQRRAIKQDKSQSIMLFKWRLIGSRCANSSHPFSSEVLSSPRWLLAWATSLSQRVISLQASPRVSLPQHSCLIRMDATQTQTKSSLIKTMACLEALASSLPRTRLRRIRGTLRVRLQSLPIAHLYSQKWMRRSGLSSKSRPWLLWLAPMKSKSYVAASV